MKKCKVDGLFHLWNLEKGINDLFAEYPIQEIRIFPQKFEGDQMKEELLFAVIGFYEEEER